MLAARSVDEVMALINEGNEDTIRIVTRAASTAAAAAAAMCGLAVAQTSVPSSGEINETPCALEETMKLRHMSKLGAASEGE